MLLNRLKLNREAMLFDSPLYMLKAFLSVMTGYLLFSQHAIIGKDMISVLFGMMLSLEPVNISGIKSGLAQFEATILGGLVTAAIITLAGVNLITVPLAVMMTLYISILLDWRNISPVAFFTSIYMTQYIQFTTGGDPSMLLTLRLRLMALGAGVFVAIAFNFLFSLLFYRSMVRKRTIYLLEKQSAHLKSYISVLGKDTSLDLSSLKGQVTGLFADIDFIANHISDLNKEKGGSRNLKEFIDSIGEIRLINHYFYDLLLETENQWDHFKGEAFKEGMTELSQVMDELSTLDVDSPRALKDRNIEINSYKKLSISVERLQKIISHM